MRVLYPIGAGAGLVILWFAIHHAPKPSALESSLAEAESSRSVVERKPRFLAPRLPSTAPVGEPSVEERPATNFFTLLQNGEMPRLTLKEVEPFLQKNGRSVESLLGAFDATKERALLREAAEKYPDDPRVNFRAFFRATDHTAADPASPEARQQLEALAKSAPDNALANYLLAFDDFKSGKTDQGVQQLLAAAQKGTFQDYSRDFIQNAEEAYRAAGWPEAEAKAVAMCGLELPHLAELKQAGLKTLELAQLYRQNGDEASAQAALQLGLGLGQRLEQPGHLTLIEELVGYAIERKVFAAMDPASPIGDAGQTVQSRLDAIAQRRAVIKETVPRVDALMPTLAEAELANYFDRMKLFGEEAATQWLLKTRAPQPAP